MRVLSLLGHNLAIRRVKYSPFDSNILCSASYDMNVNLWDLSNPEFPSNSHSEHTEFAVGLDFSMYDSGVVASCGWDGRVCLWNFGIAHS